MKYLLLAVALLIAGSGGAYLLFTADKAPTHASLQNANLAPLIPVSAFYADTAAEWGHKPSLNAKYIANLATEWGQQVVQIRKRNGDFVTTLKEKKLHYFFWSAYEQRINLLVNGRLWSIDPENSSRDEWLDVTPRGFSNWDIVLLAQSSGDNQIVASRDRDPKLMDLYTTRPDGGGKKLLFRNQGKTINWVLTPEGEPIIRVDRNEADGSDHFIKDDDAEDGWRLFKSTDVRETFYFPGVFQTGKPLLAVSNVGRDKTALVEVDLEDGSETVIHAHENVDVGASIVVDRTQTDIDFLEFHDGYPSITPLTTKGETVQKLIAELGEHVDIDGFNNSPDGNFVVAIVSIDERSYETYLFDLAAGTKTKLQDYSFSKFADALAKTKPVSFSARDGVEIPAFLTLPVGVEPKQLPTIVQIHGGPAGHVVWRYDREKQFLVNRGYAVLDVNFRGSTGYGKEFTAKGYGAVGKEMQTDIMDAAQWLIDQGIADEDAIAVMGGSYGGYSSALAMTRDAGTFAAGVIEVAVTDIPYQMDNNPFSWGLHLDEMKRYFGDPENEADRLNMTEQSPITHVANANAPILLLHGKRDQVVGFEQSEEFERSLKAENKEVTAHYFERAGHGYGRWQDRVVRARMVEDFLAEHLGGRSGGRDWSELAAEWF